MSHEESLAVISEDAHVIESGTVAALVKSEIEAQLDAAHRYPRSIKRFLIAAKEQVHDADVAMSCIYMLPRKDEHGRKKLIPGPSIRLAEICASTYGNLHVGRRVVAVEHETVTGQGLAWDLESNLKWAIEVQMSVLKRDGKRYSQDMITMAANGAASRAARDAIFSAIPRAYINQIYEEARKNAVGTAKTFVDRRAKAFERLTLLGLTPERILARVNRRALDEVTPDNLVELIALGTSIKNQELDIDEAFPVGGAPISDTRERGVVDLGRIQAGTVANRGHGDENIGALTKNLTESIESLRCDDDDFKDIVVASNDAGVKTSAVIEHVCRTMGFSAYKDLTKARKGEVLAWIAAQPKTKR